MPVSVPAQELDSLRAIMENKDPGDRESEDTQKKHFPPISVDEKDDGVNIKLGDKDILDVTDTPDSTRIRVGDREFYIVEKNDDADIHFGRVKDHEFHGSKRFRGHWSGIEWGLNNFLDDDLTLSREGDAAFMDLVTDRSWCINLNFAQYSLGFGTSHAGLLTGIGLQYNNYFFDNANSLAEVNDYVESLPLNDSMLIRSKLTASFLRIPLTLEIQFPGSSRSRRIFLSAGMVAGIKLDSHSKVVTKGSGGKNRDKNNDDFNISPFRYGVIASAGYGNLSVFGEYYFTPMFVADKGPELHPFSIGLAFSF